MSLFSITENKQSSFRKFITYDRSVSIPEGGFEFLGSCNGLFCFRGKPHQIIIWNPSSNGNLKTIPDVRELGYLRIFGFGYDERHDDYKVVYAYNAHNGDEYVVLVYSFKHGTWKRIEREFSSGFVNPIIAVFEVVILISVEVGARDKARGTACLLTRQDAASSYTYNAVQSPRTKNQSLVPHLKNHIYSLLQHPNLTKILDHAMYDFMGSIKIPISHKHIDETMVKPYNKCLNIFGYLIAQVKEKLKAAIEPASSAKEATTVIPVLESKSSAIIQGSSSLATVV
nr:F-box/kelch-repeat protein At3g23880-like [Ipomoea batatas]